LHGIASNTALKPASVYNWNGVYRPRSHLAPWRLFGFRHTQTMRVPSITQSHDFHDASSNICREMVYMCHLRIQLRADTYSLFQFVNYVVVSTAPSGSAADGESVFTIRSNPKYEANSAGCMLCLISCYYNWKKYVRHRYYSADICQYKSM